MKDLRTLTTDQIRFSREEAEALKSRRIRLVEVGDTGTYVDPNTGRQYDPRDTYHIVDIAAGVRLFIYGDHSSRPRFSAWIQVKLYDPFGSSEWVDAGYIGSPGRDTVSAHVNRLRYLLTTRSLREVVKEEADAISERWAENLRQTLEAEKRGIKPYWTSEFYESAIGRWKVTKEKHDDARTMFDERTRRVQEVLYGVAS